MHEQRTRVTHARGFTLIELIVVIGMLAILSTVAIVAVNPLRQFAEARNAVRQNDVTAILNAVNERMADNGGSFIIPNDPTTCNATIPITATDMGNGQSGQLDIRKCLVPAYISNIPHDPQSGYDKCNTFMCDQPGEKYDTDYTIAQDPGTGRITVCAPGAAEPAILGSNPYCLTR